MRVPRRRVAGTEQQLVGFRVVVAAQPRRRAAGLPQVARPGLAGFATGDAVLDLLAVLVDVAHVAFHGRTGPQQLAVGRVVGFDLADHAELATGHAGDQLAVDHQRRGGDRVAGLVVGHGLLPHHLAGVLVEGNQLGIQGAEDHQVAVQGDATVDHVTARHDAVGQARVVLPQLLAGTRIHREHPRVGGGQEHHAILDQRLGLLAALLLATEGEAPHRTQLLDVVAVEGFEGAVALALQAHAVGDDLVGGLGVLEDVVVGDGPGRHAGQHQRKAQGGPGKRMGETGVIHCGYLCGFIVIAGNFSRSAGNSSPQGVTQQLIAGGKDMLPW
ncbi:hypothetical protein D3C85_338470 [compost metagenome]